MEHVVFFPSPDGTPAFRRLASLDDAARFVEHLRNVENVNEASVHSLTEVPLAFKAWYRVELPQADQPIEEAASSYEIETVPSFEVADEAITDTVAIPEPESAQLEIPAPATIAEVIESYTGSSTGIVVPDRQFAPQQQYAFAPVSTQPAEAAPAPVSETTSRPFGRVEADGERRDAQVLEPAFGARRDRGIGYFAR